MSYSIFVFHANAAYAHDSQQDTFMALAAMYVEASPVYREVGWLRDWQTFWMEEAGNQGNGCSDLDPQRYLTDDDRIVLFREFLDDYRSWVSTTAASINLVTGYDADKLVDFTETMEAVITGDRTNPRVIPSGSVPFQGWMNEPFAGPSPTAGGGKGAT
ncbi:MULTISPECIES: hypothetical protein [unclassified Streptomyces]|uniref:hypothetical protein n=1 Tax=unclassified Streptomyces TaxID=2593676 RepID=UPI00070B3B57|nr:hypothetical protein [Streptomyces sp. Root264]KRD23334.1 hypothetical protein ASE41_10060 [Streptomyces sp. Root264]